MRGLIARSLLVVVPLVLIAGPARAGQPAGMPDTKNGDWTHYTADMRGATYSPLDQTTAGNVSIGQR